MLPPTARCGAILAFQVARPGSQYLKGRIPAAIYPWLLCTHHREGSARKIDEQMPLEVTPFDCKGASKKQKAREGFRIFEPVHGSHHNGVLQQSVRGQQVRRRSAVILALRAEKLGKTKKEAVDFYDTSTADVKTKHSL